MNDRPVLMDGFPSDMLGWVLADSEVNCYKAIASAVGESSSR